MVKKGFYLIFGGGILSNVAGVVLAAGKGTRMKSRLPKVAYPLCGKPMLTYVLDSMINSGVLPIVVVVGYMAEEVKEICQGYPVSFAHQEQQLGTGHAVLQAEKDLIHYQGPVLITCGDTPLHTERTFKTLIDSHVNSKAAASILTAIVPDPTGYGRVIRENGEFIRIVEEKDASIEEKKVNEVNAGTYCINSEVLFTNLKRITTDNVQKEYYLPDVLRILRNDGYTVNAISVEDATEIYGVNDPEQLAKAEAVLKSRR
jgi:UDP-N-acetylglucosamine diphosphorylase/glucosamine-1-phosphate N-acetyltransferase